MIGSGEMIGKMIWNSSIRFCGPTTIYTSRGANNQVSTDDFIVLTILCAVDTLKFPLKFGQ